MDLWLNVVSMGEGLRNSDNFKYALTTSESSCTTGVEASGTFKGKANGSKVELLSGVTTASTYYLYIWLDAAEESQSTMNQSVNLTLGGECTNEVSSEQTVYTVNLYNLWQIDDNATDGNSVWQGQPISNSIIQYNTPEAAITALEAAYSNANSGTTKSLPFFLKHTVGNYSGYCGYEKANDIDTGYHYCLSGLLTQSECNNYFSDWNYEENGTNYTYICTQTSQNNAVTESYVGFVVTPEMATANPGMVVGTYYLKGGDTGASFLDNVKTIYDAFGGINCYSDGTQITATYNANYNPNPSSVFYCKVSGLSSFVQSDGNVDTGDNVGSYCEVFGGGDSSCDVAGN